MNHLTTSTSQRTGTEAARRLLLFAKMLEGFRDRPSNPESVAKTYVEQTADLPFDALAEAVRRFERSQVEGHNPAFAPSSAQLYGLASEIVEQDARIARLRLPAPSPEPHPADNPEMRARVLSEIDKWEAWKFSRAEQRKAEPSPDREAQARRLREQWARSVEADGGDPNRGEIPVSPALERLVRVVSRETEVEHGP